MPIDWAGMDPKERAAALADAFRWIREENGGRLPFTAYQERVKTWHTLFVDVAVVNVVGEITKRGTVEVLLERRPKKGHLYPGMWDFPGGNLQTRELLFDAALRLVSGLELTKEPLGFPSTVVLAGTATYVKTPAEVGVSCLFVGKILKRWPDLLPKNCQVFNLDQLPDDLIPWQAAVYPDMIRQFLFHGPAILMEYRDE